MSRWLAAAIRPRRAPEQALIRRWLPPFNKKDPRRLGDCLHRGLRGSRGLARRHPGASKVLIRR